MAGALARYGPPRGFASTRPTLRWEDFTSSRGQVVVHINPIVLDRDDAILAVMIHEVHEVAGLERELAHGPITVTRFRSLVDAASGTLHVEAWDVADAYVEALIRRGDWP
jgi:hypothetical protein